MEFPSRRIWTQCRIDACLVRLDKLRRGTYTIEIDIVEELLEHLRWMVDHEEGQRDKYRNKGSVVPDLLDEVGNEQ